MTVIHIIQINMTHIFWFIVFIIYLGYIFTQNKTFYQIYFVDIPNQKEIGGGLSDYIHKRLQL